MLMRVSSGAAKSTAGLRGLWRRVVAALRAPAGGPPRRGEHALGRHASHDIGSSRMHQDYAPRGRAGQTTARQLHARAERLAAGLPE